jgi:hypothetical protein
LSVLSLGLAACGGSAATAPQVPSAVPPAPNPDHDFALMACADTNYGNCLEGIRLMMQTAQGSTVAVCEYADGQGDVVIIESRAEAEAECSGGGSITPSRVVRVVEVPES